MANTFDGYNREFPNKGIHFFVGEVMKFRQQLTVRQELQSRSGWSTAFNNYLVKELEKLADTVERIADNPDVLTQEELEDQAADTTRSLADDYNVKRLTSDNVLMPPAPVRQVVWDLTGAHKDIPQLTVANCPNDVLRGFVTGLDQLFVEATRLDSRHDASSITKYEATMLRSLLNELYVITQDKGGSENRSDIPEGTLPSVDNGPVGGTV